MTDSVSEFPDHGAVEQRAPRKVEVVVLVGLGETDTVPTIAGCIDAGTIEVCDPAETDAKFAAMRAEYLALDPTMRWREATVHLDSEKLLRHFAGPIITGEVAEC